MAKATAVAATEPGAVVIGGDQLVSFEGSILGKPGTAERGRRPAFEDGRTLARVDHRDLRLGMEKSGIRPHRRHDPPLSPTDAR